jgi:hypothetical protein
LHGMLRENANESISVRRATGTLNESNRIDSRLALEDEATPKCQRVRVV